MQLLYSSAASCCSQQPLHVIIPCNTVTALSTPDTQLCLGLYSMLFHSAAVIAQNKYLVLCVFVRESETKIEAQGGKIII